MESPLRKRKRKDIKKYKHLQKINELEKRGEIFVIRPTFNPKVKKVERNQDKLRLLYLEGKEDARRLLPEMMDYLAK